MTDNQSYIPSKYEKFVPGLADTKKELEKCGDSRTGQVTAVIKGVEICCGSIIVTLVMIILSALPIAMIAIGSVYLHQCPGRDKIPIWLIVFGVFSLFQTIVNGLRRCTETIRESSRSNDQDDTKKPSAANRGGGCCEGLISLFLFAWLIVGSVWVFGYWSTYNSTSCVPREDCCHPVPYLFSFITLIVMYAVGVLSVLICCCCCCCIGCCLCFAASQGELASSGADESNDHPYP